MDHSKLPQPTNSNGWWAVYAKHQHERAIRDMLTAKGLEVFLPLYDVQRRRSQRTVQLSLPLFPGYLFVREQQDIRLLVVSTPGVHSVVAVGERFGVIPDHEIRNLQIAMAARRGIEPHTFCRIGEPVRIVRGPLCGIEGTLVRQSSGCRVVVAVQMLARAASVEVHVAEIEGIQGHPPGNRTAEAYGPEVRRL